MKPKVSMMKIKRKSGFILLLVVPILALIGMVLGIVAANSRSLIIQTRRGELRLKAENACQSGLFWIGRNADELEQLIAEEPVILTLEAGQSPVSCRIERMGNTTEGEILQITGHAEDGRYSIAVKLQVPVPIPQ